MTISAYQVDNVIKAYNKQSKARLRAHGSQPASPERYTDVVSLSGSGDSKAYAYKKISYSLLDVIVRDKK